MTDFALYIDGKLVDLASDALVSMTYTQELLTEPAVVKNSYSQRVTLKGTPRNNVVFGQFPRADRRTSGAAFSPLAKTPFVLFKGSEVIERGYVKLDKVDVSGSDVTYVITLYGGLGEFLYALSYTSEGEKMTLADLDFLGTEDAASELDFYITRDAVDDAWSHLAVSADSPADKWDVVNFAPCYNGYPDDFNADKAIFKPVSAGMAESITEDSVTYTTRDGWALVNLGQEYTEWQTRDLRSYLQRPVVSMRAIIEACANPANNGGRAVHLDPLFFNNNNPYWTRSWLTLPILRTIEQEQVEATIQASVAVEGITSGTTSADVVVGSSLWGGTSKVQMTLRPIVRFNAAPPLVDGDEVNMGSNAIILKVYAYDIDGNVIGESAEGILAYNDTYGVNGTFLFDSASNSGEWVGDDLVLTLDGMSNVSRFEVSATIRYATLEVYDADGNAVPIAGYDVVSVPDVSFIEYESFINARTGSLITKRMMLNTASTPADYLLSFCKAFGLHFLYDKDSGDISIVTRNTLYTGEVVDLSERIHRGKKYEVKPFIFDAKWYDWGFEYEGGAFADYYKEVEGATYGRKRVNTGYDFDPTDKQVLDGNTLKGACEVLSREKYNVNVSMSGTPIPAVFLDGEQSYTLYNGNETTDVDVATPTADATIEYWNETYKTYDAVPRVQLEGDEHSAIDGDNVLLFFRGFDSNYGGFMLTDDTDIMGVLNEGEPCWILNGVLARTYIPSFGRYLYSADGARTAGRTVYRSLDMGTPREVDIPDVTIEAGAEIYAKAWERYIADRYDVDSRVVTAYVDWRGVKVGQELLRKFYYFDGSWWVLNKISNYTLKRAEAVQCEFVKIKDKDAYKEGQEYSE